MLKDYKYVGVSVELMTTCLFKKIIIIIFIVVDFVIH